MKAGKFTLRPYQAACVKALLAKIKAKESCAAACPTGSGKTAIGTALCQEITRAGGRVLVVTHRKELIDQISQAMPEAGVLSAGLRRRQFKADVIIASVQTIMAPSAREMNLKGLGRRDVVLVDEAHRVPVRYIALEEENDAEDSREAQYLALLRHFGACKAVPVGLTATPYRLDGGLLYGPDWYDPERERTERKPFLSLAYEIGLYQLLREGFLCPAVTPVDEDGKALPAANVAAVKIDKRTGDFDQKQLAEAVEDAELVRKITERLGQEIRRHHACISFCASVRHAKMVADCLRTAGIESSTITAGTASGERSKIVADYKARRVTVLLNVGVLTEGFDAPHTDLVALLRPTASRALFVQMVGRGMRLSPGKDSFTLLDFGSNLARLGPLDEQHSRAKTAQTDKRSIAETRAWVSIKADATKILMDANLKEILEKNARRIISGAPEDRKVSLDLDPASLPVLGRNPQTGLADGGKMPGVRCKLSRLKIYTTRGGAVCILAIYVAVRGGQPFPVPHLVRFASDADLARAWAWWRLHFPGIKTGNSATESLQNIQAALEIPKGTSYTARHFGDLRGGLPIPNDVPEISARVIRRGGFLNLDQLEPIR